MTDKGRKNDLLKNQDKNFNENSTQENQREEYYKEYLKLSQECKELKERLERTEEDLKYQCVDCMNVKSDRYRKAITRIREIAEFSYRPYNVCGEYNETCSVLTNILNVIKDLEELNG